MPNPFYNFSNAFIPGSLARAEQVATEFSSVQAGFSILAIQGVDSGAANAYVVTTNGGPTTNYADGNIVEFKAANANTGASTINVNGIGAVGFTSPGGASLAAGAIIAGTWYRALYNSTYSAFTLIAPITLSTTSNTISSAAPPKVGLVAAGGASTACVPIDAVYALDQSIAPTWTGAHIFANSVTFNSTVAFAAGLMLTGGSSQYAATLTGNSSAGHSLGLEVNAGVNGSDIAFLVNSQNGGTQFFEITGVGSVVVGAPTGGAQGVGTINATGLFVNGVAVSNAVGANPSASVGLATVNGTASTYMRSDAAPPLSQAIAPTWTGAHTFTPSSAVTAVTINAAVNALGAALIGGTNTVNTYLLTLATGQGSGFSSGVSLKAGTTSADIALLIQNAAATATYFQIKGDGSGSLGYNGTANVLTWDVNGHVIFAAPTAGGTSGFTFNGRNGNNTAAFNQAAGAGSAFGVAIKAGTNSSDYALLAQTQSGTDIFRVRGDGAILGQGPVAGANVEMTPDIGTTLLVLTGIGTSTAVWSRNGNQVTMCLGTVTAVPLTNLTQFTVTGIPVSLLPTRTQKAAFDNSGLLSARGAITNDGGVQVQSNGTFSFGTFGTSTLGTPAGISTTFNFSYLLN